MKKLTEILLIVWAIGFALPAMAQELTVESMVATNDQTANDSKFMKQDNKGVYAGLVKVRIAADNVKFEGHVVEQSHHGAGEYWVFVADKSDRLRILTPGSEPLEVRFKDYGVKEVLSRYTYVLTIASQMGGSAAKHAQSSAYGNLNVDCRPVGAEVYLDGQLIGTCPRVFNQISVGSHMVEVKMDGYATFTQRVSVEENAKVDVKASLSAIQNKTESFTVNGVTFTMVEVEGGTFVMGSPFDSSVAELDERPPHPVSLRSFFIGQTEVTQALWEAVMGNNPSSQQVGDDKPVNEVKWDDCHAFISKLNALTGKTFRLPTEAEWEYAARGGKYSRGYQFAGSNDIDAVAWHYENSHFKLYAVAQKRPNELGLYDMTGNVSEWCEDFYDDMYYSHSPSDNPCNTKESNYRVSRGGNYSRKVEGSGVCDRYAKSPSFSDNYTGLRLVGSW